MDNIKPPKNFTLSWESIKAMLDAFKAGRTVADVTREVFQVIAPTSAGWTTAPIPALALASIARGSHSTDSRAFVPAKAPASTKCPAASKLTFKEPIAISESAERDSKGGAEVAPLDVQPLQAVAAVVIRRASNKRARTSKPTSEGKAAKRAHGAEPGKTTPTPSADKGKGVVEQLSSAPDNELLNIVEVTLESMPT